MVLKHEWRCRCGCRNELETNFCRGCGDGPRANMTAREDEEEIPQAKRSSFSARRGL